MARCRRHASAPRPLAKRYGIVVLKDDWSRRGEQCGGVRIRVILGKLFFLQLPVNLRCILLDYEQKRADRANPPFSPAC
jgi:hypothetical protein